jgi:Ulp1 family protease
MMVYYLKTYLASHDEEACRTDPERRMCHFLSSQFWKILYNQDHSDSNIQGKYAYNRVRTWRNSVPGKDVFSLDKLFIPINQGGQHWVFVVVFVQQKRIGIGF